MSIPQKTRFMHLRFLVMYIILLEKVRFYTCNQVGKLVLSYFLLLQGARWMEKYSTSNAKSIQDARGSPEDIAFTFKEPVYCCHFDAAASIASASSCTIYFLRSKVYWRKEGASTTMNLSQQPKYFEGKKSEIPEWFFISLITPS
mgnify:FL=1